MSSRMNKCISVLSRNLSLGIGGALLAGSMVCEAALPPRPAPVVSQILRGEGEVSGGVAGVGFSMMDLRRTADTKKNFERIVIDIGDMQGHAAKGMPAYFHAELKKNPSRLVLDFDQMPVSRIDDGRLSNQFKNSIFVKKSSMILDPEDKALNLTLDLKPGTNARIFQVPGKKSTSKVVVDLFTAPPVVRRR